MSLLTDFNDKKTLIDSANDIAGKILNSIREPITTNLLYRMDTYEEFSNRQIDTGIAQSSISSRYTIFMTLYPYDWSNYRGVMGMHSSSGLVGFQYENGAIKWAHHNSGYTGIDAAEYIGTTYKLYNIVIKYNGSTMDMWCNGTKVVSGHSGGTLGANR